MDVTCDSQTLKYLSSLPFLQSLDMHLSDGLAQGSFLGASSDILHFLVMRHLRISIGSIADAGEFLQVTSSSSVLKSLSIAYDDIVPTPEQLHNVLAVVQWSAFHDTLTTFALQDNVELDEDSPPLYSLDAHTPLLQCQNLEHILIDILYGHARINNSNLKKMALAWPCLCHISLCPYYHAHLWHSKANLRGLNYLGQHCHSLQSVSLQFNVSTPATAMHPDKGISCESLTQLDVSCSHVSDPLTVTTFLADVFPKLKLHYGYFIRPTLPGPRTSLDFGYSLSKDKQSLEFIAMGNVVDMLKAMRQEWSQSLTNPNVHIQPHLQLKQLKKFSMQSVNHHLQTVTESIEVMV